MLALEAVDQDGGGAVRLVAHHAPCPSLAGVQAPLGVEHEPVDMVGAREELGDLADLGIIAENMAGIDMGEEHGFSIPGWTLDQAADGSGGHLELPCHGSPLRPCGQLSQSLVTTAARTRSLRHHGRACRYTNGAAHARLSRCPLRVAGFSPWRRAAVNL